MIREPTLLTNPNVGVVSFAAVLVIWCSWVINVSAWMMDPHNMASRQTAKQLPLESTNSRFITVFPCPEITMQD
jgi:hypothetical protein